MHFDIAIIGAGSGNMIVNRKFADKKVAILEEGAFGGTCLNVGCIPTKMFVYAADVAHMINNSAKYGITAQLHGVDWASIVARVFRRIEPSAASAEQFRRSSANTTVFDGHATFVGERRIDTGTGAVITADQVVLAAGARPIIPAEIAHSPDVLSGAVRYHTNETIMHLPQLPRRLVIVGSGVVACEFAHVFGSLGSEVSLLVRGEHVLRHYDDDIVSAITEIAHSRWKVHTNAAITQVRAGGDGSVRVELANGTSVDGDVLLVATGRQPNGDLLNPAAGGVELHEDGRVVVDKYLRTTAPGVWALGDVSAPAQLKHLANQEARVVQHNLLHPDDLRSADHRFIPKAVFTHPQIAAVGLTEKQARAAGHNVAVVVHRYSEVAYGWAMEDTEGFCKLVADRATGQLLGAHILGDQAPTVIQPLIQAMTFGLSVSDMARGQYWIHPGLPEVVENALLALRL